MRAIACSTRHLRGDSQRNGRGCVRSRACLEYEEEGSEVQQYTDTKQFAVRSLTGVAELSRQLLFWSLELGLVCLIDMSGGLVN